MFTGEGKVIPKANRTEVSMQAKSVQCRNLAMTFSELKNRKK